MPDKQTLIEMQANQEADILYIDGKKELNFDDAFPVITKTKVTVKEDDTENN